MSETKKNPRGRPPGPAGKPLKKKVGLRAYESDIDTLKNKGVSLQRLLNAAIVRYLRTGEI